ncbi:helix-turn-helix domain-containing protein [Clostridium sp. BL-8]|uniref:winged helix-turn-helix transcriptional regulator n=1 Tax=Clostridium sp. BL-8 TaxID=349938 RepID=UPI00098C278A|nr:helix-turn-helix domain-containing protein [Clostridium sp. BL-8]OOM77590.1 putative HTH-type transcriptional regulator YybR [Clostridium sp. BL-8]
MTCGKLCPIEETVKLIGHKWKVLILRNLHDDGTQRFNQLERGINGISQKMLTQQLRQMEADGLIIRKVYPEVPLRVEYSLSELGKSLKPVLDSMNIWGENYIKSNKHSESAIYQGHDKKE